MGRCAEHHPYSVLGPLRCPVSVLYRSNLEILEVNAADFVKPFLMGRLVKEGPLGWVSLVSSRFE